MVACFLLALAGSELQLQSEINSMTAEEPLR
jgi:hypothetical protein